MKKVAVLVSAFVLIAGLTFAQTPQTQEKGKAAPAKTETTTKKDGKDCSKTCTQKEKSGCCAKKGESKDTKAPEKK
ncbi:MAG: hypothetical protein NTW10_07925 [Bacteroidetes bacterium]|nr:hypothetical protein [Bacteroidota bacterium]